MRKPLPNIFPVSTATMRWSTRAITLAPKKLIRTRRASEGSASEPSLARRVRARKKLIVTNQGGEGMIRE